MKGFSVNSVCTTGGLLEGICLTGSCYFTNRVFNFPSALLAKNHSAEFVAQPLGLFRVGALRKRSTSLANFRCLLSGGGFQSGFEQAYCLELSYHQYAPNGERMLPPRLSMYWQISGKMQFLVGLAS